MAGKSNVPVDIDPSKATILVVDDNLQNLELLQAYLEDLSCKVILAQDGVQAMRAVAEHSPDLILLDIMMPKMSGFEVCRRLKEDETTCDIPVVMITALNELGDIERAVAAGTDDFLSKPINKLELLIRIKSLLRISHLKGELERTLAYLQEVDSPKKTKKA